MKLAKDTIVAVADGEKFIMFRNVGDENALNLRAVPVEDIEPVNSGSGARHLSSAANPDDSQQLEDGFTVSVADSLNRQVLDGKIKNLVIIAAPRTLGELRRHYHKTLSDVLAAEIDKDLTGHPVPDIEKAILAA